MAKRARAKPADPLDRIVRAALELAGRRGWRHTRMFDIAEAAGLSLREVYAVAPSKLHVVAAFLRGIDDRMIAGDDPALADEPARDRLFDVIMRRFDLLNPHKDGVVAIFEDMRRRPFACACLWPIHTRSLAWMLETARIDHNGLSGMFRIEGLGLIMLGAVRVWRSDDSDDMARTMTFVDRQLRRVDGMVARFGGIARSGRANGPGPATEASARAG